MKLCLIGLFLPLFSLTAQVAPTGDIPAPANTAKETPDPDESAKPEKEIEQYRIDLDNLPLEQKKIYWNALMRAEQVFNQKRIFECLESIHEAELIYPNNPSALNLKGACYVEFRAFEKAATAFDTALVADPENINVLFNKAEIDFVTQNWQSAHDQLEKLLPEYKGNQENMKDLIIFKVLLCKLKLNDKAGVDALLKDTTFLDDTPLYYYGIAAIAYSEERTVDAEVWLARASRIFGQSGVIAPWQDTLIEFGYIKSFYGGDLEVE
jgi:tetratricopeptide (TPR) repeat protein